ncbi:hypothetical protein KR067_006285, partial [Drosophila pandora]
MRECQAVATPLESGYSTKCEPVGEKEYQSLIGLLMYLANTTSPDIFHSVAKLAQRNSNPHREHAVFAESYSQVF